MLTHRWLAGEEFFSGSGKTAGHVNGCKDFQVPGVQWLLPDKDKNIAWYRLGNPMSVSCTIVILDQKVTGISLKSWDHTG